MKPCRFHREAEAEYFAALRYYAEIDPLVGQRFYFAVEELLAQIGAHPKRFRIYDSPVRRHFGGKFPYSLIYLDQPDRIWIVAVAHFKQRPGYWKNRLT